MVLILSSNVSDPKTTMMLRKLREKNAGYNSLSRLEDIMVTYKHEVDNIQSQPTPKKSTNTQHGWERNNRGN